MFTPIFSSDTDGAPNSATNYGVLTPSLAFQTTENIRQNVIAVAGTISELGAILPTAPGVGKSYTFTLMVNGVASALSFTISGTDVAGSDMVNSVTVTPGDLLGIRSVPSGTPTAHATGLWTAMFEATTSGESPLLGGLYANAPTSGTNYMILCGTGPLNATEANVQQVIPTGGTLSHLYVDANGSPGVGKSYAFTLRKNGIDTALSASIVDNNTSGNDTTDSVSVVAGDLVSMKLVANGTPTARRVRFGLKWTPTINGESLLMNTNSSAPSNTVTTWNYVVAAGGWSTTETSGRQCLARACTIKKLYVNMSVAPGAGKSRAFSLRRELGPTDLTCTVSDTATTANDTVNEVAIADNDGCSYQSVPSGTPTAGIAAVSAVAFIAPASANHNNLLLTGVG